MQCPPIFVPSFFALETYFFEYLCPTLTSIDVRVNEYFLIHWLPLILLLVVIELHSSPTDQQVKHLTSHTFVLNSIHPDLKVLQSISAPPKMDHGYHFNITVQPVIQNTT